MREGRSVIQTRNTGLDEAGNRRLHSVLRLEEGSRAGGTVEGVPQVLDVKAGGDGELIWWTLG